MKHRLRFKRRQNNLLRDIRSGAYARRWNVPRMRPLKAGEVITYEEFLKVVRYQFTGIGRDDFVRSETPVPDWGGGTRDNFSNHGDLGSGWTLLASR